MANLSDVLQYDQYVARKRMLHLIGGAVRVFDQQGRLLLYVDQRAFKLREEIRVFADEAKTTVLLLIKARQILDFSATYDVMDTASGQTIGSVQRLGVQSMVRDLWELSGSDGAVIATLQEDHLVWALLRRLVLDLVPQRYDLHCHGRVVGMLRRNWNPFTSAMTVDVGADAGRVVPRVLVLSAAILLLLIEGKQD